MTKRKPYPAWICSDCGDKWGRRECGVSTWHPDTCSLCGKEAMVTEPRDYGHLKEGWENGMTDPCKLGAALRIFGSEGND